MSQKRYKIVFIGAGSFRFTIPCSMNILDFARQFHPVELWFVDIVPSSLKLMGEIMNKMIFLHRKDIKLHLTTDRTKALPDADYVLISISIGMQYSEWYDIHIPFKFGIPQNTGDTVGPGGILRGVRTIPSFIEIFKDIEKLCPNALVLNYTNPQGTLMLSAFQNAPKLQSIGLCHEIFYVKTKRRFGRFLTQCGADVEKKDNVRFIYGGLNHFSWITELNYGGLDLIPEMQKKAKLGYETEKPPFHRPYNYYLLDKLGYFTYVEDRHVAEFIPRYYNYFNHKDKPFGITDLRDVRKVNKDRNLVYNLIRWAKKDRNYWFIWLVARPLEGGEKALLMAKDKENNRPRHHVCNILNNGTIPSLPNNCAVEVPCYFQNDKLVPVKNKSLPKQINELVLPHAKCQQLVVNAALSGDPEDLLKALLADPMCQFIEDEEKIEAMMYNMLYYEQRWLPKFSESIPKFQDLNKSKYFIERKEFSTFELARKVKYHPDPKLKEKAWPQVE